MSDRGKSLLNLVQEKRDRIKRLEEAKKAQESTAGGDIGQRSVPLSSTASAVVTPKGRGFGFAVTPEVKPKGRGFGITSLETVTASVSKLAVSPVIDQATSESNRDTRSPSVSSSSAATVKGQFKKEYGTLGREVETEVNYVQLNLESGKGIYEYEVTFSPSLDFHRERRRIMSQQVGKHWTKTFSFDGTKLLLPFRLPDEVLQFTADNVLVQVKFKGQKNPCDSDCIHLLNIIFRDIMKILGFVQHQRSYYDPSSKLLLDKQKLEIWPGYVTTVCENDGGLLLECDVSFRVLRNETPYDVLKTVTVSNKKLYQEEAKKKLIGASVLTRYNNMSYRIDDIDFNESPSSLFTLASGKSTSLREYYSDKYGLTITDPSQPLLINRPKQREGEKEKTIALIPELCNLTGISDEMKKNFAKMKDVSQHIRVSPQERRAKLRKFVSNVVNNPSAAKVLSDWGFQLHTGPVIVKGRVQDSVNLWFGVQQPISVKPTADFTREATNTVLLKPKVLENWLLVFPKKDETNVTAFFKMLQRVSVKMGVSLSSPHLVRLDSDRPESYLTAVKKNRTDTTQLVVTVFPQQREDRYAAVKKYCYCENPIASQVLLSRLISRQDRLQAVTQKIGLQINAKLGGELWGMKCPLKNIMIVGIDVFHQGQGKPRQLSSVAGVVCSMNDTCSRFFSNVARQKPGQELMDDIGLCFVSALKEYRLRNHILPSYIVVFRDGVSDAEIKVCADHEVKQMTSVFEKIDLNYKPEFAFVVVQKRINSRIFLTQPDGNVSNPPPGTIVDRVITRKNFNDFLLVSQKANEGTVTPSHLIVVYRTERLSVNIIQKLAYVMTFMYYNWTGSVRVPAVCQYAHKLVGMVGEHLGGAPVSPQLNDKLFFL